MTFYGADGALDLEPDGKFTVFDVKNNEIDRYNKGNPGQTEHVANFLTAIRNGQPQQLNAEISQGHRSTLLCHLGNIAHRVQRKLICRSTDGHILRDAEAMALWQRNYAPGWEPSV